jgi:hypothetical protein
VEPLSHSSLIFYRRIKHTNASRYKNIAGLASLSFSLRFAIRSKNTLENRAVIKGRLFSTYSEAAALGANFFCALRF